MNSITKAKVSRTRLVPSRFAFDRPAVVLEVLGDADGEAEGESAAESGAVEESDAEGEGEEPGQEEGSIGERLSGEGDVG